MRISLEADVDDVLQDLRYLDRVVVPRVTASVLNRLAQREIESPATKDTAAATDLPVGVVRWHHTAEGVRTRRRRIRRTRASATRLDVEWRWSTKSGEPGAVSFISLPGRRQTKAGFRSARKFVPSGFIQRTKRGQKGAFVREGATRYPIRFLRRSLTREADAAFDRRIGQSGPAFRTELERRLRVQLERQQAPPRES